MASASVPPKVVVMLLLIHCLLLPLLFVSFVCVLSSFYYAVLSVLSSFAIISLRKESMSPNFNWGFCS